ncbi:hypothetical protein ABDK56_09670 [Sphingomonas sp. ASV193]|uniref:hypothetical protein n=1 Tax=Sphingomonas sp. ASV193 TaxID=3144405 RepID=UPI0032E89CDB
MAGPTPSDEEIFRRIAASRGQPVDDLDLPQGDRQNFAALSARARDLIESARRAVTGIPEIHFGFVRNATINAFAAKSDGRYFVGVHTGVAALLRLLTGRMLADPGLFPLIGDPSRERADLPRIAFYAPHADQMLASEDLVMPCDPLRQAYMDHLVDRALMFFVGHEIAHIANGHVDYLREGRGLSALEEDDGTPVDDERLLERRVLEFDADRRSIMASVNSLRDTQFAPGFEGMAWGEGADDAATMFRDWSAAISILFRMFGDPALADTRRAQAYPPLLVRWQSALAHARYGIDRFWPGAQHAAALEALAEGRREVARAFATIAGNSAPEVLPTAPPPDYLDGLQNYWNDVLLERVRPYAYEF